MSETMTAARIMDPEIRAQLPKVRVVADPEIEAVFPALQRVAVEIACTDGRRLERSLDYPKGDLRNRLDDREVEGKLEALTAPHLDEARRARLVDAIWKLEELECIFELMALCEAGGPS